MMDRISSKSVIIFGVGGVGSWCAESLVRSGISHLTIIDSDRVCITNVNRQLQATTKSVGLVKVEALKERLLEINPQAKINAVQEIYTAENAAMFQLETYDYIIDSIDSLKDKIHLILHASECPGKFFSAMGAALKMDPTKIQVAEFWEVIGCPLASIIRKRLRQSKTYPKKKFLCVFSPEVLPNKSTASTCGTNAVPQSYHRRWQPKTHQSRMVFIESTNQWHHGTHHRHLRFYACRIGDERYNNGLILSPATPPTRHRPQVIANTVEFFRKAFELK